MITLYGFRSAFGLPDLSPFVTKVETYFHMAGVPFEKKTGDQRKAPRGKFPYIEHEGQVIPDSTLIIEHCKKHFGDPLDGALSPRDRAVFTAFKSMLEEHFYFITLYLRWQDDRGWAVMSPEVQAIVEGLGVPSFLRPTLANYIRKDVTKKLHAQGTGRQALAEVDAAGARIVDACADQLGDRPFLLGDAPTSFDATAYAFLVGQLRVPIDTAVRARALSHKNLVDYCDRITAKHFGGAPAARGL